MADTKRSTLSRRQFAALSAGVALTRGARAQTARPLTIGILNDMSGPTAALSGAGAQASAELALEDFGPTVLGRPIVLLKADHQAKADLGAALAREWFDGDVRAIFDIGITTVALSVQQLARDKNRIAVFTSTGTVDLTRGYCSPNGVHWTYDSHSVAAGAARANMPDGGKTWFFMTVDYVYGRSLQAEATSYIEAHGGKVLGAAKHPFETKDFSADLLTAKASGADLIALATPTPQIANIVKQAAEFGMLAGPQKLAPIGLMFNDVKAIGPDLAQGLLVTEPFYWDADDASRAFAKRYFARQKSMPNSLQASVYGAVMHYLKAVAAANTEDTGAVLRTMKATPVNDFMTRAGHIRADGRLVRDVGVYRIKSPAQSSGEWGLYQALFTIPGDQAFSPPDAACKLVENTK